MDFAAVAELCAPGVAVQTLSSIVAVESSFNPFAIGVVGGRLQRQPGNLDEAIATSRMLTAKGYDYSIGLAQINQKNFTHYGLTNETGFDPCTNLRVGALIFQDCYRRAGGSAHALGDALSCYHSGNFKTGYRLGYVDKVFAAGGLDGGLSYPSAIPVSATTKPSLVRPATPRQPPATEGIFVTETYASAGPDSAPSATPNPRESGETALLF